jgi:xylulokinase
VENFGPDVSGLGVLLSPEEVLEVAASKLPPGAEGLMLVPYWKGVLSPYWDSQARGITIGWTGAHRKEHFYRAILEGIAFEHRLAMEAIGQVSGQPANEFILMGGGSRSALWCQIIADVTGKRATRAGTTEASALGAGILAAAAAGWYPNAREAANAMTTTGRTFEPSEATHLIYDRLFSEVYRGLFPVVQQFVHRLAELTEYRDRAD